MSEGMTNEVLKTEDDSNIRDENESSQRSWEVSEDPNIGRILVATRDISPWEMVIEDTALVAGPKIAAVCLGCLTKVEGDIVCSKCEWPLCSPECEDSPRHQGECGILASRGLVPTIQGGRCGLYPCITVLRVLLLKVSDPKGWALIQRMMDHWEERKTDPKIVGGIKVMETLFKQRLGLDWIEKEDVEHAYGVLKTNAVDLKDGCGQALFPQSVCIMSHSCFANIEPVKNPTDKIALRAKRKIKKGEELTIFYTDFLESRHSIRKKILNEWKFLCQCERCRDRTEFGSNFSSFKCACGGYFYEDIEVASGQKTINNSWICSKCKKKSNLCEKYKRADDLWEMLPDEQMTVEKLDIVCQSEGYHKHFYPVVKAYVTFIEQHQHTNQRQVNRFYNHKSESQQSQVKLPQLKNLDEVSYEPLRMEL